MVLIITTQGYFIGFPAVVLIMYFVISYLSLQIVSISIASNIKNKKMANAGNLEYIGITILVMTILWLLAKLPILGILIWFILMSMALGIMMKYIFNNKEKDIENKEENTVETKE